MPSSLEDKLTAALKSRDARLIRRRLPDPAADAPLADFHTNDYLSLTRSPVLRARFLAALAAAPDVLGSGGSRLLVNGPAHSALEARLARFFAAPAALLFNSGFDANAAFFASVPQPADAVVHDEHIHASVHDGLRASRVPAAHRRPFAHNDPAALRAVLARIADERPALRTGASSVFVAVESLYSMDGTLAPLQDIVRIAEELFPRGNAYVVVDEAHATGVYGPQGRGLVAMLGLERRVLARLHTFGKALAGSGAVVLTTPLIRDYMLNYARPLIYTTSLSYPNIVSADCSFDLLEDGTAENLARQLLQLSTLFLTTLRALLARHAVPPRLLALPPHLTSPPPDPARLPTPIVPVMTPRPRPLSAFLRARGLNARPITWPTVPKGKDRIRVCVHAGNSRGEVEALAQAMVEWALAELRAEREKETETEREQSVSTVSVVDCEGGGGGERVLAQSKL